jgi:hypothetical protein
MDSVGPRCCAAIIPGGAAAPPYHHSQSSIFHLCFHFSLAGCGRAALPRGHRTPGGAAAPPYHDAHHDGRAALLRGQAVRQHRPTIDSKIVFIFALFVFFAVNRAAKG